MSGFLLDTNVVSEMTRSAPDARVLAFLGAQHDFWLSSVVVCELEFGVRLLPQGRRRDELEAGLAGIIAGYEGRILPLERREAEWAAELRAHARRSGRVLDLGDAFIAGTAKAHDLAVATRNITDFEYLDIDIVNPWEGL